MKMGSEDMLKMLTNRYVIIFLASLTGVFILIAIFLLLSGQFVLAESFGNVITGLATVLLVIVTLRYVRLTKNLVELTQESHEKEIQLQEIRQKEEIDSLRRGLIREIDSVEGIGELGIEYHYGISLLDFIAPSTVYENNSDQIGRLKPEEVGAVAEYYTRLEQLDAWLNIQKEVDSPYGKDSISRYYKHINILMEELLRRITFGMIYPMGRDARTKLISAKLMELEESQQRAISKLEENLQK